MSPKQTWSINPAIEAIAIHYGLDPAATGQWAIAMGDYPDPNVTENDIAPDYWQARIKYVEFLDWLRTNGLRFPHSVSEAQQQVDKWLVSSS